MARILTYTPFYLILLVIDYMYIHLRVAQMPHPATTVYCYLHNSRIKKVTIILVVVQPTGRAKSKLMF